MHHPPFRYHAFGLHIHSEIELPSLRIAEDQLDADLVIVADKVSPSGLKQAETHTPFFQCADNHLWLNVPDIARFLIQNGRSITVDTADGVDPQSIRLFLLGSCIGAILHQRNILALHGNAIRFGDQCVVFAGHSGAGKSTLAAAFHQRGHDILADDICAIDPEGRVLPSFPQLKLWQDAAKRLEIDTSELNKIRLQINKYAFPIKQAFNQPLPLAAIYILTSNNENEFSLHPFQGMEKFTPLKNNTYRMRYLDGLGLKGEHLKLCSKLAGKVHVARMSRPNQGFRLKELVEFILTDLQEKGITP